MAKEPFDLEYADKRPAPDARTPESGAAMVIGFYVTVAVVVLVVGLLIFLSTCAADFKNL
jgi:hypothetical protein